jgi:hypothetical protein
VIQRLILAALLACAAFQTFAAPADEPALRLQMSPYTLHYSNGTDHQDVWLVGLELERERTLFGVTYFRNSFGQPSAYAYPYGKIYRNVFNVDHLFVKWTIGILYGYKHPYEHKVPLNYHGFSPVIIPAFGWELPSGFSTQINFLGTSGLMFQLSKDL